MAGTPEFKVQCYLASGLTVAQYANAIFKMTWDFFKQLETAGYCTEIARNNGLSATGTDFYDGLNPFQTNAWAVFQFNASVPYYVHFQYTASAIFGTSPGNPALFRGTAGSGTSVHLGFSMATALTSGLAPANPWNGTTGSLGSDTKGSAVWAAPVGGTLYVFPMSNSVGGTHATNKENMVGYTSNATTVLRADFIADEDNWFININRADATTDDFSVGGGIFTPVPGCTAVSPLFMFTTQAAAFIDRTNVWGTTAGTGTRQGGISGRVSEATQALDWNWNLAMERATPNAQTDTANQYGLYRIKFGYALSDSGEADSSFWRVCYGFAPKDTDTGLTKMVFDNTVTLNTAKLIVPWDTLTVRGVNVTRNGVINGVIS